MESSSDQAPIESHRPWWKLHLLTWVLVLLVGGSLVVENLVQQKVMPPLSYFDESGQRVRPFIKALDIRFTHGWPFKFNEGNWGYYRSRLNHIDNYLRLIADILISLAILLATASTIESYLRRKAKWQFSIQGIMVFTAFVALILANAKYDLVRWKGNDTWEYIPFFFIAAGMWCVFWTGLRLIGLGIGRICGGAKDG